MTIAADTEPTPAVDDQTAAPAPRPARRRRNSDAATAAVFLAPTIGGFGMFTLLPIVGALVVAFTVWPLAGDPSYAGLDNFRRLFSDDPIFLKSVLITLIFVLGYVPLNLAVSLGLAAWISPRIRRRNIYRVLFFLPVVTPIVANAAVWELMLMPNGVVDSISVWLFDTHAPNFLGSPTWALPSVVAMSLWMGFGYNLLVFSSALDQVPETLIDAAHIDGAGPVRLFFSIKLPVISPAIFFAAIMTIITSFQVFAQPYILTGGGPANATSTVVIFVYKQGFQFFNLGYAAAAALILFVLVLLVSGLGFLLQRKLVHYE